MRLLIRSQNIVLGADFFLLVTISPPITPFYALLTPNPVPPPAWSGRTARRWCSPAHLPEVGALPHLGLKHLVPTVQQGTV